MKKSFERAQRRREEGHGYKHDLGQNFLYDDALLEELVQSTGVTKADSVLEIGPGSGMLTKHLCPHAGKVLAVEVDHDIIPFLKVNTAAFSNLEIVEGDIRKQNLRELCAPLGENFLVIANIPYNITTPIFEALWESGLSIRQISVMIQKEVAEKLMAAPSTAAYGLMSVKLSVPDHSAAGTGGACGMLHAAAQGGQRICSFRDEQVPLYGSAKRAAAVQSAAGRVQPAPQDLVQRPAKRRGA